MDTDEKYLDAEYYVRLAGEREPEFMREHLEGRRDDPDDSLVSFRGEPFRDHHQLDRELPIDGVVSFYWPDALGQSGAREDCDPLHVFDFPFRSVDHECSRWFVYPENDKFSKRPVWKWENPSEDPHESITLSPSLGIGQPLRFHAWLKNGEVEFI